MPGILCEHCTGYCCRYIALPIDPPTEAGDFEDIRWYLLHEGISVFVEDGDWYLNVSTTCRHLQADFRCGIYEIRPQICRDYSTDNCDYHSGDYGWEHHFTCPEHLDDYVVEHFKASRKGKKKSAARGRKKTPTTRLRVRLGKRTARRTDYAAAIVDTRGIALPLLATLLNDSAAAKPEGRRGGGGK